MRTPDGEIRRYHSGAIPFEVDLYLSTYEGMGWVRRRLRGQSGWLQVATATMDTFWGVRTATLAVAMTDHGELLGRTVSHAILEMRASGIRDAEDVPPDELDDQMELACWDFLGGCDLYHLRMLDEAERELAVELEREQARGERVLAEVDGHIADLRKRRRAELEKAEREELAARIDMIERKHAEAADWLVRRLATIRDDGELLQDDIVASLQNCGELEVLFTIRWVARHVSDRPYRAPERNQRMTGLSRPVNNPYAESLLAELRLRDAETDEERRKRKDHERAVRLARWHNRPQVKTQEERERDRIAELASLNEINFRKTVAERKKQAVARKKLENAANAENLRIAENAARLRSEAQLRSAKRRALDHQREREIAELLQDHPTLAELERELDRLPSVGIENRRTARLLREAIRRISPARNANSTSGTLKTFTSEATVSSQSDEPVAAATIDSIDIDALIDSEMRAILKDLL